MQTAAGRRSGWTDQLKVHWGARRRLRLLLTVQLAVILPAVAAPFPLFPVIGKGLTLRGYTVSEIVRDPEMIAMAGRYVCDRLADRRFICAAHFAGLRPR